VQDPRKIHFCGVKRGRVPDENEAVAFAEFTNLSAGQAAAVRPCSRRKMRITGPGMCWR